MLDAHNLIATGSGAEYVAKIVISLIALGIVVAIPILFRVIKDSLKSGSWYLRLLMAIMIILIIFEVFTIIIMAICMWVI